MMRFSSLKTNIAVYLALLMILAIGLTDFVLVQIMEREMVENRIETARRWLNTRYPAIPPGDGEFSLLSTEVLKNQDLIGFQLTRGGGRTIAAGRIPDFLEPEIARSAKEVVSSGDARVHFAGRTWGVFWPQSKYAIVSEPFSGGRDVGTGVMALEPIYETLRGTQKLAAGYLAINFFLLLLIGSWRISRLVTRPLLRFIRITDDYQSSDRYELFPEKQDDEFSRLSTALNQMLRRIDEDRHKLRDSLQSLEKSNRDLKAAQQEIIRAEKLASIGRLSAGLAHEIGNPIGIVLGYLGLLSSRISPEDDIGKDYIQRAESEINRINQVIRQLLDFSRSTPVRFSDVRIHDLLKDAGAMLSQQPLMENIRFEYRLEAADDNVFADYHQLQQVFVNLVINAADSIAASENGVRGKIIVQTGNVAIPAEAGDADRSAALELKVVDNGAGIAAEHMDKIFDPFFTTKETGKGTGLGLSVSYMIIEQFGGEITAFSRKEKGTEIVIRLPIQKKPESD